MKDQEETIQLDPENNPRNNNFSNLQDFKNKI